MSSIPGAPLSVLMPLKHYQPRFLREALDSLIIQRDPEWRLVIVVEPEELARFRVLLSDALGDPRVRVIPNEGRKLAGAFNTGMRVAATEFVAILLSDDLWAENAVRTLRTNIREYADVDFFHSARRIVDGDGNPLSSVHLPVESVTLEDFAAGGVVKHLLCWRRKKGLAFGGMDESLNSVGPDDYDFPWMMLEHGAVFRAIHEPLYVYRDHRDGYRLTTHLPRSVHVRELRRILTKHRVNPALITKRIRDAKHSYLRECIYRNEFHRWFVNLLGWNPTTSWRQTYR